MESKRWWISGRVQGVWFRGFTHEKATALGLVGTVRNVADGRVEVCVAGPTRAVEELRTQMAAGPRMAEVTSIVEGEFDDGERARLLARASFEVIR